MTTTKFRIVPKRDFGPGSGFFIDGRYIKSGFVVTDPSGFCNVMPGAIWFLTIEAAYRAIRIWCEVRGNVDLFYVTLRSPAPCP